MLSLCEVDSFRVILKNNFNKKYIIIVNRDPSVHNIIQIRNLKEIIKQTTLTTILSINQTPEGYVIEASNSTTLTTLTNILSPSYTLNSTFQKQPRIKFLVSNQNCVDILNRLSLQNSFKPNTLTIIKRMSFKGKTSFLLEIDSTTRTLIGERGGNLLLDGQFIKIIDTFVIKFCTRCSAYNHTKSNCPNDKICLLCSGRHTLCPIEGEWEKYRCPSCCTIGHSAWYWECSQFQQSIKSVLNKIQHEYDIIFLEKRRQF